MDISELKPELEALHHASLGWALSCCRHDRADAEEVLQTVYLKILQGKAIYRGESKLRTWLFAVIRKTAVSERRKRVLRTLLQATTRLTNEVHSLSLNSNDRKCSSDSSRHWPNCRRVNARHCIWSSTR